MNSRRTILVGVLGLLLSTVSGGCGPPQIGPDRDTFKAVDALYTAVSLRDPRILERCGTTLQRLRSEGKLPESAARALDSIVIEARAGHWGTAQARLGEFIRGQRS
jgi:hypothetical protein